MWLQPSLLYQNKGLIIIFLSSVCSRHSFWINILFEVSKNSEMQPSLPKFTIKIKGERNDVEPLIPSSISGQAVISRTTTSTHQDCKREEQIDINSPAFQDQQENNFLRTEEATSLEKEKDNSSNDDDDDDESTSTFTTSRVYLSNKSSEGSCESDMGHDKLAILDSVHLEGKTCVTKASAPNQAIRAFRLLKESAAVQTVVASIASDPNVLTAVMKNEEFLKYFQSQDTGMDGSLDESPADTEIPGYQSHKYSDDETFDEKESKNGFNGFFKDIKSRVEDTRKDIKSRVEDMRNSLSSFFQNPFAGSASADGIATVEKTMGASIMGLAVMVIMVVVLKRA